MGKRITKNSPEWKQFEIAVANFLKAMGPDAKIEHDQKIPDKHTGELRQRDVWIQGRISIIPVKIMVSCKRYKAKVNQQHMDAFLGELDSSGANKGVIYSKSGFTKPALKKAEKNEVSCYTLYEKEPPAMPDVIFIKQYCARSKLGLAISTFPKDIKTADQLFDEIVLGNRRVIDVISEKYAKMEDLTTLKENMENGLPKDHHVIISLERVKDDAKIILKLKLLWNFFEAKTEAHLVEGSYSFTEQKFSGTVTFPTIATQKAHPGEGWTLLEERPILPKNRIVVCSKGSNVEETLRKGMVGVNLPDL